MKQQVQVFHPQPHRLFSLSSSEQKSASIVETRQALAGYYEDKGRMFNEEALVLANNRLLRGYFTAALSNELKFELVAEVLHELELLDESQVPVKEISFWLHTRIVH